MGWDPLPAGHLILRTRCAHGWSVACRSGHGGCASGERLVDVQARPKPQGRAAVGDHAHPGAAMARSVRKVCVDSLEMQSAMASGAVPGVGGATPVAAWRLAASGHRRRRCPRWWVGLRGDRGRRSGRRGRRSRGARVALRGPRAALTGSAGGAAGAQAGGARVALRPEGRSLRGRRRHRLRAPPPGGRARRRRASPAAAPRAGRRPRRSGGPPR